MKKKYIIAITLIICLVTAMTVSAVVSFGCKNKDDSSDGSDLPNDSSSLPSGETDYTYIITGATDLYVNTSATKGSIDYSAVTARRENGDGDVYPVEMDDSSVEWGVGGIYTVKYVCGKSFVENKIYIYNNTLPVISGATDKTVSSAAEILDGVTATDQFGFSLALTYFVNGAEKGSLAAGDNSVEIKAADIVGNVKTVTVKITLKTA